MRECAKGCLRPAGRALGALFALLAPLHLEAQGWPHDVADQQRLIAGQVLVQEPSIDPSHPSGRVRASVFIHATPEAIWRIITDCREELMLVPGMLRCRVLGASPDGRWQDIEHEVRYSWLVPTVRWVFRAEYERPRRVGLQLVSGDLRAEEGQWRLSEKADVSGTIVEYEIYVDPGFWVPQLIVRRALRNDLPEALRALKRRLESPQPTRDASR